MDRDEEILKKTFPTRRIFLSNSQLLKVHQWVQHILWADVVYLWFASYFALPMILVTQLLGRRLAIVTGGYDVAKASEIHHGTYAKSWLHRFFRTLILRAADEILCVSEFNRQEAIGNAGLAPEKCKTIFLAVDSPPAEFKMRPWNERFQQAVMVASVTEGSYQTKGLDQLLLLAERCPEISFVLVGSLDSFCQQQVKQAGLSNLKCTGFLPYHSSEFLEALNQSKVALQLSFYESFGAGVVDAGLCGCEMLVFGRGALPQTVGKEGFVVPYGDLQAAERKLWELMQKSSAPAELRIQALAEKYSVRRRSQALTTFIEHLADF